MQMFIYFWYTIYLFILGDNTTHTLRSSLMMLFMFKYCKNSRNKNTNFKKRAYEKETTIYHAGL